MGEPDQAHMVFSADDAVTVWPLSAASVTLLSWPESRGIVAEPAVAAITEQLFKRTVTLQQVGQRRLQAAQSAWDLAQFDMVNSGSARTWKRVSESIGNFLRLPRWRAARLALVALLLVNLIGLNAWAWKEQSRLNAQRAAIRDLLTSTFPNVRVVVDAPIQMAKEVAALQQASGASSNRDLDVMLSTVGALIPANTTPTAIEYAAGELRLKGLALKSTAATAISFMLKPKGYMANIEGDALVVKQVSEP